MYLQYCQARKRCPQKRRRCGAVLIEFAFIVPVMFTLVFATFEFGRCFMVAELLTEGARIGCRKAIVEGTTSQQIRDAVTNYLAGLGINGDTVGVIINDQAANSVEASTQPAYTEMTVKVTVPVSAITWVPNPVFTKNGTLSGQFTMRRE